MQKFGIRNSAKFDQILDYVSLTFGKNTKVTTCKNVTLYGLSNKTDQLCQLPVSVRAVEKKTPRIFRFLHKTLKRPQKSKI